MSSLSPRINTPPVSSPPAASTVAEARGTGRLKQVPEDRRIRERIRTRAISLAGELDKSRPPAKHQLEEHARCILGVLELSDAYLGWTMVALNTAFWHGQVTAIPPGRRLLLLPHCMRNLGLCPADYDQYGLRCRNCGNCSLGTLRELAQRQGYRVLVAEGSPIVMQILLAGQVDAVLGVACLNSLEKALDKILLVGLPSMAVPLLTGTCSDSASDEDWIREMIATPYLAGPPTTRTYLHLLRCAAGMFDAAELDRLVPRTRSGPSLAESNGQGLAGLEPIAATEAIARDFLLRGGKHLRPFITLAAYDAMTGGHASAPEGRDHAASLSDAVKRIALAIEVFHKASLVHDDIEDDDSYRYGLPTLHRKYGLSTAVNVGDYLIGLGYRLVAAQRDSVGAEAVADILARLSDAHTRLCEGQGAELAWRDARQKRLAPLDALKIYALKTAPAFETALYAGLRLAGSAEPYREAAARFSRHLGIAFQILNDLDDWSSNQPNKRVRGTDLVGGRPTVLWALATEALGAAERAELESLAEQGTSDRTVLGRVRELYDRAGVHEKASALVAKHDRRAREIADQIDHGELRRLLHYFADTMIRV
ncbi:MAG: polyprenyl synthetase family protein [Pirellulales bacterium]|nr:polyprenyl synthetase family protein [Pirellulales bacterium]